MTDNEQRFVLSMTKRAIGISRKFRDLDRDDAESCALGVLVDKVAMALTAQNPEAYTVTAICNALNDMRKRSNYEHSHGLSGRGGGDTMEALRELEAPTECSGLIDFVNKMTEPFKTAAQFVWMDDGTLKDLCAREGWTYRQGRLILDFAEQAIKEFINEQRS